MIINQFSRRTLRTIRETKSFTPNKLSFTSPYYRMNMVRWEYKTLRKKGVDEYTARAVIWNNIHLGSLYGPEFIPGDSY